MAVNNDVEIHVDTRFPFPKNVDGLIYYVAEDAIMPTSWQDTSPDVKASTPEPLLATPVPREVVEQKVTYALGGTATASAVLIIDDIPYVGDYEIRIVPA